MHQIINYFAAVKQITRLCCPDLVGNYSHQNTPRTRGVDLLALGLTLLKAFVAAAGMGDEGEQVTTGDRTLQRSDQPRERWYRSIFGKLSLRRWVYARGTKNKIEHAPTDARLGLPRNVFAHLCANRVNC